MTGWFNKGQIPCRGVFILYPYSQTPFSPITPKAIAYICYMVIRGAFHVMVCVARDRWLEYNGADSTGIAPCIPHLVRAETRRGEEIRVQREVPAQSWPGIRSWKLGTVS
jgi:hypothetical protein